jgi:hypothetical protein
MKSDARDQIIDIIKRIYYLEMNKNVPLYGVVSFYFVYLVIETKELGRVYNK